MSSSDPLLKITSFSFELCSPPSKSYLHFKKSITNYRKCQGKSENQRERYIFVPFLAQPIIELPFFLSCIDLWGPSVQGTASLDFTSLRFPSLQFASFLFSSLHLTALHFSSVQFTSLHFSSLHPTRVPST